jgi:hypothetical protein
MSDFPTNLDRMIALAEEFFETKSDPDQISVTQDVMEQLRSIHPATMSERDNGDGPVAWVIVIPTTHAVMDRFMKKEITEQELLDLTTPGARYEAIYLCSALVLPEERGKGIALELTTNAIESIRKSHPIKQLFVWAFSEEGERLAREAAKRMSLPLLTRK